MKYDMENQFQKVYIISKSREFQQEFIGKVHCEVLYVEDFCGLTKYEACENIIINEGMKKNLVFVFVEIYVRLSATIIWLSFEVSITNMQSQL